jgi:phosphoribosylamine-glycine ligase
VFAVATVRETLAEAVEAAYKGVGGIKFPGMQFRRDIGAR